MNENSLVGWLAQNIPLHLGWCNNFVPPPGMSREELIELWIRWGLANSLIGVFGGGNEQETVGYIFARPIRATRFDAQDIDYFGSLFEYDRDGTVAWIDTLWAPGQYGKVLAWLKRTRRRYVAWQHKHLYYLVPISALSGTRPIKSQVKSALVRA